MAGSAAPARRWLLIEHPGPWEVDALAGSGIDAAVQDRLLVAARSGSARILLVRRPGRQPRDAGPRAWAVIDHSELAGQVWGTWRSDDDLLAAVGLLRGPTLEGQPTTPGDPVLLVCAHGRHDTCCAVRGRPVAAALAERWRDWTWECSHVGGDRFAANLVVLPDGAYYGRVEPTEAVDLVEAHLHGKVDASALRGVSTEPPVVQAAIVEALRRFGPAGVHDVRGAGLQPLGHDAWTVYLDGSGAVPPSLVATVTRSKREPALLTCRATAASTADGYVVRELVVQDLAVANRGPMLRHGSGSDDGRDPQAHVTLR
jgi:(2Fe-2S) ferredoxin